MLGGKPALPTWPSISTRTGLTTYWAFSGSGRSLGIARRGCWATSGPAFPPLGLAWKPKACGTLTGEFWQCFRRIRESIVTNDFVVCQLGLGVTKSFSKSTAGEATSFRRVLVCQGQHALQGSTKTFSALLEESVGTPKPSTLMLNCLIDAFRLCQPWITLTILRGNFGELADEVASHYLVQHIPGRFIFTPAFDR